MKLRPMKVIILLLLVALAVRLPTPASAQAAPSLLTDQKLYTLRDKQVALQGTGYDASSSYTIWVQAPGDTSTHNTNLTFTTTDKGEIPPAVSLTISPNAALGTFLLSVSNSTSIDAAIARAHYGLWGTDRSVYQRTEVVVAKGGGILPMGSLKFSIRDPAGAYVYDATVAANETGTFLATWKIPPNAVTESYTAFVDGVGTYDMPSAEFVSISKFSVTPASLNVTLNIQPEMSYKRMETVTADFALQYPDSSPVTGVKEGLMPVALYAGQFKIADLGVTASGTGSGVWVVQFKIPRNATLDVKYKLLLVANSFDDGNGNVGPVKDVETGSFSVTAASLRLDTVLNSTSYQIPFDTVSAYTQVSYPDGTPVSNVTVSAWLAGGGSKSNAVVVYDEKSMTWIVKYQFLLTDLLRSGSWVLTEEATDVYGNRGSTVLEVMAEPYLFLGLVLAVLVAVLLARWMLSKYWHRIYLRAKRARSAIRSRLEPPSLGRYFSVSPVTP